MGSVTRSIGERRDADLVENIKIAPHARGLDLRRLGLLAERGTVRAPDSLHQAVDVLGLVAGPEVIKLDFRVEADVA